MEISIYTLTLLDQVGGWVPVCCLEMAARCILWKKTWAMFGWETLGPGINADVTLTSTVCLKIVADHVHPFEGFFQQDNTPCKNVLGIV